MSRESRKAGAPTTVSRGLGPLLRQAFAEFMTLPVLIIVTFLLLAPIGLVLDTSDVSWLRVGRDFLGKYVLAHSEGTSALLGALLSGLLTIISITFSVLLLAVQQTASTLTNEVYDQFLRRRVNQVYFGYFIGLAVYTLIALAAVSPDFNPVYTTTGAVVLTALGLCLLILLIYSTIDQMRPVVIIESIHNHTLHARDKQQSLLARTRRNACSTAPVEAPVEVESDGFLQDLDLDALAGPLAQAGPGTEVRVLRPIGTFAAYGDVLAVVRASDRASAERLVPVVRKALKLRHERDLDRDPSFGVVQLETMAWTTASSAKSTPEPPRLVVNALRDLLARWACISPNDNPEPDEPPLPVVYPDHLHQQVIEALVTTAVASNESLQHVVMAEVLRALGLLQKRVKGDLRPRVEDGIRRLIPALRSLILTADLDEALTEVADSLRAEAAADLAGEVGAAHAELAKSVGRLRP